MHQGITTKPSFIDFGALERNQDFRSDLLFFIRLAGTHAQEIFWAFFPKESESRRKKLKDLIGTIKEGTPLRTTLEDPEKRKTTDIFNKGFLQLLRGFDPGMQETFKQRLKQHHGIFLRFDEFVDTLELLMEKRHWLEHYEERIKKGDKGKPAVPVLEALGLLLLPEVCGLLSGCVASWSKKLKTSPDIAPKAKALFDWCNQDRRNSNKAVFSSERERGKLDKSYRKALLDQPWHRSWLALCPEASDYTEKAFHLRFTAMGKPNIREIGKILGCPIRTECNALVYADETRKLNFKQDIEPFYLLCMKMNLVLHRFLERLPKDKKGKLANQTLREVRNVVAHNQLFWQAGLDVEEMFSHIISDLAKEVDKTTASAFCDQVESLLRKQNYATVYTDGLPPKSERVRRWTQERREAIAKGNSRIAPRRMVRKVAGKWIKALQHAGEKNGLPKAGKNAI